MKTGVLDLSVRICNKPGRLDSGLFPGEVLYRGRDWPLALELLQRRQIDACQRAIEADIGNAIAPQWLRISDAFVRGPCCVIYRNADTPIRATVETNSEDEAENGNQA